MVCCFGFLFGWGGVVGLFLQVWVGFLFFGR